MTSAWNLQLQMVILAQPTKPRNHYMFLFFVHWKSRLRDSHAGLLLLGAVCTGGSYVLYACCSPRKTKGEHECVYTILLMTCSGREPAKAKVSTYCEVVSRKRKLGCSSFHYWFSCTHSFTLLVQQVGWWTVSLHNWQVASYFTNSHIVAFL